MNSKKVSAIDRLARAMPWALASLVVVVLGSLWLSRPTVTPSLEASTQLEPVLIIPARTAGDRQLNGITKLREATTALASLGLLRNETSAVLDRIPALEELISAAGNACRACTVDVILQAHVDLHLRETSYAVRMSQQRVYQLLEARDYASIAVEGSDEERFSAETFAQEITQRFGMPIEEVREHILRDLQGVAPLQFSAHHPESDMIGAEDKALNQLHMGVVQLQAQRADLRGQLEAVSAILRAARSEVAVSRLLRRLAAKGQTEGCLVIGNAHVDSVKDAMQYFGIAGRVFNTVQSNLVYRPVSDPRQRSFFFVKRLIGLLSSLSYHNHKLLPQLWLKTKGGS